jgi:hypothetical protein
LGIYDSAGSVELGGKIVNPFGHAEQITLGVTYGSMHTSESKVDIFKPRPFGYPVQMNLNMQQVVHSYEQWSSFTERLRGTSASVST